MLDIKIFVVSMLLQELLDETEGETAYKQKLRFRIKGMQKELDKLLGEDISTDALSLYLTQAADALDKALEENIA
jgi:hypothetical protein